MAVDVVLTLKAKHRREIWAYYQVLPDALDEFASWLGTFDARR